MMYIRRNLVIPPRHEVKKWSPGIGSVLSVVALLLSLFSFYTSEMARRDVERIDVIKTEYGLYHDLAQLQVQYPNMGHLLTSNGEAYDSNVTGIKSSSSAVSGDERARLLLQERAVANYIFTSYEETFYIWTESQGKDALRTQLALDNLEYFNNMLCSNPRLLWYWNPQDGGKLAQEYAADLREYYKQNVLKDCPTSEDPTGPFGH
jgi:hypothetical protein